VNLKNSKDDMISKGIHHITAIAGNPQSNLDFYSGLLELKFIKKTINFDDPGTYHFYFGDEDGHPGTILTFFPWGKDAHKGRGGRGQVISIAFSIPEGSMRFWQDRLDEYKVIHNGPFKRMGENVITFEDPDGVELDLIETPGEGTAITGFHSATLSVESKMKSELVLSDIFGFRLNNNEGNRYRYTLEGEGPGKKLDLLVMPDYLHGHMGVGAVHHIAFRAENEKSQAEMKEKVHNLNISATPVVDRKYFRSVYFREPNGILFEIATDNPGFTVDEEKESLGQKLQLPDWLEEKRAMIERSLYQLRTPSPERIFLSE
jgi:glyoxalase family protein